MKHAIEVLDNDQFLDKNGIFTGFEALIASQITVFTGWNCMGQSRKNIFFSKKGSKQKFSLIDVIIYACYVIFNYKSLE